MFWASSALLLKAKPMAAIHVRIFIRAPGGEKNGF
jgi:hypothetical protein